MTYPHLDQPAQKRVPRNFGAISVHFGHLMQFCISSRSAHSNEGHAAGIIHRQATLDWSFLS